MISIIIPTLNEEGVIGQTLSHLKTRFSLPHEIIVTDGKSTDKTVEIARQNGAQVVEYTGTKRQTIAEGRNDGAGAAQGEFLAFMDADCHIMDPDAFFGTALDYFARHPAVVALTVSIRVSREVETIPDMLVFVFFNTYLRIINNIFHVGVAAGEFQMMRTDAFKKVGGYNPDLVASEDVDIFFRLGKIGRIGFLHRLKIYHSGRRAHKIGWPKLIYLWMANSISMMFRRKAYSKEWTVIR